MNAISNLSRLILYSPWLLLVFLVVPIPVILSLALKVERPMAGSRLLLANNIVFALLAALKLAWYLSRLRPLHEGIGSAWQGRVVSHSARVWLEEAEGGCLVTAAGSEARQLLMR